MPSGYRWSGHDFGSGWIGKSKTVVEGVFATIRVEMKMKWKVDGKKRGESLGQRGNCTSTSYRCGSVTERF